MMQKSPEDFEDYNDYLDYISNNPEPASPSMDRSLSNVAPRMAPAMPSQNPDVSSIVSDYIAKQRADQHQLSSARDSENSQSFYGNLGKSLNQLGAGIAGATKTPETPVYDDMVKNAGQPVDQFLMDQKLGEKADAEDPNSARAQTFRAILDKAHPGYSKQLQGLPYQDAKEVSGIIQASEKNKALKEYRDAMINSRQTASAGKATKDSAKADSELGVKISTLEGRGQNKTYAESMRRGKNILDLIKQAPGGDLNKLSLPQAKLLTKEIDGFINGGAPTVAGVHGDEIVNLTQKWQSLKQSFGNKPQPAQLGAFIKQNIPYVGDVYENARKYLYDGQKDLVDSYKDRLGEEAYQRHLQKTEGKYGKGGSMDIPSEAGGPSVGSIEDGHRFKGGDPADPNNWEKM